MPVVKTFKVPLKDIVVGDRARQQYLGIFELADSIKRVGLIHPIVIAPHATLDGKYVLVAGGRRYRAMVLAAVPEALCVLRDDAPSVLAEIEYEENACRLNVSFEEEGIALAKITELKKAENPKWTQADTAEMTGRSVGDVSGKIKVAKKFEERPDLKKACADGKMPYTATLKKIEQIEEAEKIQRLAAQGQIELTTDLRHGDCRKLITALKPASIDLLLCDPPYGLERLEALRNAGSTKLAGHQLMSDTHNMTIEEVEVLLKEIAPELNRVLKPGAHWYIFCGFQYIGRFIDALDPHLEFQPPIVIWDRGKPSAPGYGYNYLSRVEAIIYGCRPPKGRRLTESMYNVIECPDVPKPLRMYPTEKPTPLLQTLIKQSTSHNGMVLDPFAGSASTLVAARESGRRAIGFEIDEHAFLRAQKRLQETNGD